MNENVENKNNIGFVQMVSYEKDEEAQSEEEIIREDIIEVVIQFNRSRF